MVLFINPRLVDTRNSYKREATTNLKELKSLMKKLIVKDDPEPDSILKSSSKQGTGAWAFSEQKKARTFKL